MKKKVENLNNYSKNGASNCKIEKKNCSFIMRN